MDTAAREIKSRARSRSMVVNGCELARRPKTTTPMMTPPGDQRDKHQRVGSRPARGQKSVEPRIRGHLLDLIFCHSPERRQVGSKPTIRLADQLRGVGLEPS